MTLIDAKSILTIKTITQVIIDIKFTVWIWRMKVFVKNYKIKSRLQQNKKIRQVFNLSTIFAYITNFKMQYYFSFQNYLVLQF